ncbi:MAG: DUF3418 domain-containing protein, partial [Actinophytocola sp.]|nr:DUF3418 domain-containing protein [Actinophytocola sp.]
LTFERSHVVSGAAGEVSDADYPDTWEHAGLSLPLRYEFDPGADADGVTVTVPLAALNQVEGHDFAWQVPGLREELVTALIKTLPKALRRQLVPAPDHARAALDNLEPGSEPLLAALGRELGRMTGVQVPRDAWRPDRLPAHLRMTFQVVDDRGAVLAEGEDLAEVRQRVRPQLRETLSALADDLERHGIQTWDLGALPRSRQRQHDGYLVQVFPALVDEGDSVA